MWGNYPHTMCYPIYQRMCVRAFVHACVSACVRTCVCGPVRLCTQARMHTRMKNSPHLAPMHNICVIKLTSFDLSLVLSFSSWRDVTPTSYFRLSSDSVCRELCNNSNCAEFSFFRSKACLCALSSLSLVFFSFVSLSWAAVSLSVARRRSSCSQRARRCRLSAIDVALSPADTVCSCDTAMGVVFAVFDFALDNCNRTIEATKCWLVMGRLSLLL